MTVGDFCKVAETYMPIKIVSAWKNKNLYNGYNVNLKKETSLFDKEILMIKSLNCEVILSVGEE